MHVINNNHWIIGCLWITFVLMCLIVLGIISLYNPGRPQIYGNSSALVSQVSQCEPPHLAIHIAWLSVVVFCFLRRYSVELQRLALNFLYTESYFEILVSCLYLESAGILGVSHYIWFIWWEDQIQEFVFGRQVLYQLSNTPNTLGVAFGHWFCVIKNSHCHWWHI